MVVALRGKIRFDICDDLAKMLMFGCAFRECQNSLKTTMTTMTAATKMLQNTRRTSKVLLQTKSKESMQDDLATNPQMEIA